MKCLKNIVLSWLAAFVFAGCSVSVPKDFEREARCPNVKPDYTATVIPCNIAPLNFVVQEEGEKCVVEVLPQKGEPLVVGGDGLEVRIPKDEWRKMLQENVGNELKYNIYVSKDGKWKLFDSFTNRVVGDSIDKYLTYRLIEPSYMGTGEIGVYQYDLEEAEEKPIFTNHRYRKDPNIRSQKCVNCHTSQKNKPENKMFYFRGPNGGLLLTYNGKTTKLNTKAGDMYASTVYPAWHPSLPFIAFSSNEIWQAFMTKDKCKIEPYDAKSDLVLYDIEKNEITSIQKTKGVQETNPAWSPDGRYLYFNSSDSSIAKGVYQMKYDIKRISFNPEDKSWGEVEMVYHATKQDSSATFARVSGNYMVFCKCLYGTSIQTNKSSDLWLMNLETKECRSLTEINSPESESYHDWSLNGRWILFTSRRQDGNYARPYFAYFDRDGKAYKPFVIPHEDPKHDDNLIKNYNVTEFSTSPVLVSQSEFEKVISEPIVNATYGSPIDESFDGQSGASQLSR
jgi:hypothetical protein